ncbi:hypothetical protein NDU88_001607 [Pleurodeles waltl]|uniref:Reverse transcriptase/retrotransposon-derived protein RNase H-like domain-containing protein n=1 Tax=Pleurodeles waltl TaxID=8319 RepID=A0AAV7M1M0_PLEWA|nr:hypothetical protein NDU88_001607 [Pleurodeles waltl]
MQVHGREDRILRACITPNGIAPKDDLVRAIRDAPCPGDKDALRSFLGLSEYYSKFMQGYAITVEPLRKLLRKNEKYTWTQEQSAAFEFVKQAIAAAPVLQPYNKDLRNVITVDAITGHTPFYWMRGRRCMSELTPKFNKWYDMREEIEVLPDESLRVKERIMAKQESNKRYADIVNRAKAKDIVQGDWVLVKKPNKVRKGESVFQTPIRVQGVTRGAVCLEGGGWRSKDDIVRLKAGQEEIIMRGSCGCGAESMDDMDEWQSHEARDVVTGDEECVNTSSMRGRIGHGSADRCEKAWRGLADAEGQNSSRP